MGLAPARLTHDALLGTSPAHVAALQMATVVGNVLAFIFVIDDVVLAVERPRAQISQWLLERSPTQAVGRNGAENGLANLDLLCGLVGGEPLVLHSFAHLGELVVGHIEIELAVDEISSRHPHRFVTLLRYRRWIDEETTNSEVGARVQQVVGRRAIVLD